MENELQTRLLEIFKHYIAFCNEKKLKYFAIGGTTLGAERHKGFIPWDDDIDVGMPRDDYNRFIEEYIKTNNTRYIIETPHHKLGFYPYFFTKMYDTSTTLVESIEQKQIKRGLYLDIFPLDGVPNSLIVRVIHRFYMRILFSFWHCSNFFDPSMKMNIVKKVVKSFQLMILKYTFINEKRVLLLVERECQKNNYYSSNYVGNLFGLAGAKEVMPQFFFGEGRDSFFNGVKIICPELTDEYLKRIYGDWRTPPPISKRCSHHNFIYDLTIPFK